MELGDVGRKTRIVELPPVEPGVEPPERAGVGPPGVRADGGLDQPARGRCWPADRGLFGVDPDGGIIHVNGNARPIEARREVSGTCAHQLRRITTIRFDVGTSLGCCLCPTYSTSS